MRLNLGSGQWKLAGYVNVDRSPECSPDRVVDLEQLPWPFEDSSCEEIVMSHVLEHLGQDTAAYLGIIRELYRICRNDALVKITVPHPRHDTFLIDPTHVRAIMPDSMALFSKQRNRECKERGISDTPLGLYLDVDFEVVDVSQMLDPMWEKNLASGKMTETEILGIARLYNNVIKEITITMKAIKPAGGPGGPVKIFGTVDTFIEGPSQDLRLGRLVANAQFLGALVRNGGFDAFHFFCPTVAHVRALQTGLERELGDLVKQRRISLATHLHLPRHLRENQYAAFHVGGWGLFLPRLAHLRASLGGPVFPLTGITHSLHTADIFSKMREVVATPFGPCDGVICTSVGGQQVMQRHWELALQRNRAQGWPVLAQGLRFPRIPLAVDHSCFEPRDRAASRAALGLPADDVIVLYLGRLSPHTKADLNPVIDVHARLTRGPGARARALLVLAGGGDAAYQTSLLGTAAELGIADRVRILTNVSNQQKHQLLAAADLFISPVDNHQETFGLAVVEAMAAGLPVIGSDFDGYRDLIEDGVTGFRVPTYGGRFPPDVDVMVGLLDPNLTALLLAQTVAVDTGVLLARMGQLIDDAPLRRRLGAAGRERAHGLFTWPRVIAQYESLWHELAQAARGWTPPATAGDPQVGSLHDIFADYPSTSLSPQHQLQLSGLGAEVVKGAPAPALHQELLPLVDQEMGTFVLRWFAQRPVGSLADCAVAVEQAFGIAAGHTAFQVIWLVKHGLLTLVAPGGRPAD